MDVSPVSWDKVCKYGRAMSIKLKSLAKTLLNRRIKNPRLYCFVFSSLCKMPLLVRNSRYLYVELKGIDSSLDISCAGRTATFYIREAIEAHLEDLEDAYLADQVLGRIQRGEESVLTAEELWRELGD